MSDLTRTTLGRLAAYSSAPVAGISVAFSAGDWVAATGLGISVVSGRLRVTAPGAASNRVSRLTTVVARSDVAVQAVWEQSSGGGFGGGVAARASSEAIPLANVRAVQPNGGSEVEGVREQGGVQDIATVASRTLPQRQTLWVHGTDASAYFSGPDTTYAITGVTTPAGNVGVWTSSGSAYHREFSTFYAITTPILTVTGLPTGWDVQILDGSDNVLATAAESGGTANVDFTELDWSLPRTLRIRDEDGTPVPGLSETPAEGIWGGDAWELSIPDLRGYRLRIRTVSTPAAPNGTDNALVITSIATAENPYLAEPPEGDGQEVDLLTGQIRSGAYRVRVIDAEVASDGEGWGFDWGYDWDGAGDGTQRVVTRVLEDVQYRQQLLSRRAYIETTDNGGYTWQELYAGYITSVILSTAIAYDFTIGDTRRIESSRRIFTWSPTPGPTGISERDVFPSRGCLAGGPIIGGFGPLNDTGGDVWYLEGLTFDTIFSTRQTALLAAREAFLPPEYRRTRDREEIGKYYNKVLQPFATSGPQQVITSVFDIPFQNSWTRYPNVTVLLERDGIGSWSGRLQLLYLNGTPRLSVLLDETDTPPTALLNYTVRILASEVSTFAPLYIDAHPVDIVTDLYEVVGIEYDQDTADEVKSYLGEGLRYALRITEPQVMGEFLARSVFGPFGFSVRNSPSGQMEFFLTRPMGIVAPSVTIPTDSLRSQEPPIFTLEEEQVVSSFKITYGVLSVSTLPVNASPPPPPDGIVESRVQVILENSDLTVFSTREIVYDFAGMVHLDGGWQPAIAELIAAIATYGFDRYGRGAPVAEVDLIEGEPGSEARIGDEVYLDVASYPNRGYRIGESTVGARIMQVVRRTEAPNGPRLKLVDAGLNQQPVSPEPTISIAQSAGAPRSVAAFTIGNASDINDAEVLTLAVEWATGASEPTGNGTLFIRYSPGTVPTSAVPLPAVRPGSTVWARARTEQVERRPSLWTDWVSVTLVAFESPDSITLSDETAESITVTWVNASSTYFTEVFCAPGTTDPADWGPWRVNIFLPGSDRAVIRGLSPATDYRIGVAHRDQGTGERTAVVSDTSATVANPDDAPTPLAMMIVPASADAGQPTGIGVALWAADETFDIEIERASDAGGAPGPYALLVRVPGVTQVYRDVLPSDGLARWYRIRHVLAGYDPSPYTGGQDAVPAALPLNVSRPALAPVLRTYLVDNGADVDVYWSGTGTIELSIDGGAFGTPGASPINVLKTPATQSYQFTATLNGVTVPSLVVVPSDGSTVPALVSVAAAEDSAIACGLPWKVEASWVTTDPNDSGYRIRITNFDTTAIVADYLTTASSSFIDNTGETGAAGPGGFFHVRRYIIEIVRDSDDVVIDSLTTNQVTTESGAPC